MKTGSTRVGRFLLGWALLLACPALWAQAGTVDANGVSLPYEISGSGPPLVLIHGWAVHRGYWDTDVENLARHYTIIRYDRRGFGEATGKPDLTADPADLRALLETLGYARAHIMGHSQGTQVALTFAVRYPGFVDGLILFGPGPVPGLNLPEGPRDPPIAEWMAAARTHGVDALKEAIVVWAVENFGDRPSEFTARARRLMEPYTGLDLLDPDPPLNLVAPAGVDDLKLVRAPTLVLLGEGEGRLVADVLTYGIADARQVVIPGGGHTVNWAEPERFAAEVLRFLRTVDRDSEDSR
jgi:pimeloyl-ACP methyl ester carboxylesterase